MIDETDDAKNAEIQVLLKKVLHYAGEMTLDELSVCFLYLTKLSVKMQTDVMTTVLELILKMIKNGEQHLSKHFNNVHIRQHLSHLQVNRPTSL